MRKFTLNFWLGNDVFIEEEKEEVKRILKKALKQYEEGNIKRAILDINGNHIGDWEIKDI